ncbi:MAG: hypothetical protein V4603_17095 [Pseudomonadota bacterium]
MLEFSEEIPFLWRLSAESGDGFSLVSMVIPFQTGSEALEHTIQTDVVSFSGDHEKLTEEETLEWNEDDIQLFLKLLSARNAGHVQQNAQNMTHTFKVDLTDPDTIEIVNIVAAAGFGMALMVDDLLVADPGDFQGIPEPEVGLSITLHTVDGYKRGIVVGGEEDEVVCVLLDSINLGPGQVPRSALTAEADPVDIHAHDLVIVKPHQLLPARYSSHSPAASDTLH